MPHDQGRCFGPYCPQIAWAKLRALVEGAELATKILWSK